MFKLRETNRLKEKYSRICTTFTLLCVPGIINTFYSVNQKLFNKYILDKMFKLSEAKRYFNINRHLRTYQNDSF